MSRRIQDADVKGSSDVTADSRLINDTKIYITAAGINQRLDQAITAGLIGGGSGINYITNSKAESDTSGWATYADAAGVAPVDGTGGSATGLTFSRSTSSPLRGSASFLLAQANSTSLQGKGVSYDFTIDSEDQAKVLTIGFDYNASSTFIPSSGAVGSDSDIEVYLYDKTNAVLIAVSPKVITANGANNFSFRGVFQTASNSTSYRVILHVATTSANATGWNFKFDNVSVGPQATALGAAVTDWIAFTPTFNWGTSSTTAYYRRVGDSIEISAVGTLNGSSLSGSFQITLPFGLSFDTNKLAQPGGQDTPLGWGGATHSGTSTYYICTFNNSTTARMIFINSTTNATGGALTPTAPVTWASGDTLEFRFSAPVVGWGSTTVMSQDTDTRVVAARVMNSSTSLTAGTDTKIVFANTDFDTHGAITIGGTTFKVPVSGVYRVSSWILGPAAAQAVGSNFDLYLYKNGVAQQRFSNSNSAAVATYRMATSGTGLVNAVAGDTLELYVNAAVAGSIPAGNTNAWVAFERLTGPATIAATDTVAARYYNSATSISGSAATVSWTTKDFDTHNAMSSGTFTVPVSGKYQVNSCLSIAGTYSLNQSADLVIQKNGTTVSEFVGRSGAASGQTAMNCSCSDVISCLAGDTIRVQVSSSATSPSVNSSNAQNFFSIVRVGN